MMEIRVSWDLIVISTAVALGMALGRIRIRGIRLGVSGVLFSALLFGQLGAQLDPKVLEPCGAAPSSFSSTHRAPGGAPVSLRPSVTAGSPSTPWALLMMVLGGIFSLAPALLGWVPSASGSGLFSGAFTCTPGLGAAQEALHSILAKSPDQAAAAVASSGLAYAVTYPFGLVGAVFAIAMLRRLYGVRIDEELDALLASDRRAHPPVEVVDFEVTQVVQTGPMLKDHPLLRDSKVTFTAADARVQGLRAPVRYAGADG